MNTYELTILFSENLVAAKGSAGDLKDKTIKAITEFVKKHKGEINKQESWGSKHLAYPIKKHETAVYEHLVLGMQGADQLELDKVLRLDENILRYMFIRV